MIRWGWRSETPIISRWGKIALSFSLSFRIPFAFLHASPRAHRYCISVASWNRSANWGAYGLRSWGMAGWASHQAMHPSFPKLFNVTSCVLQKLHFAIWSQNFCALPQDRPWFRRLCVLKDATQLSRTLTHCNSTVVATFSWLLAGLTFNLRTPTSGTLSSRFVSPSFRGSEGGVDPSPEFQCDVVRWASTSLCELVPRLLCPSAR